MFQCSLYSNLVLRIKNWFSFTFEESYSDSVFFLNNKNKKIKNGANSLISKKKKKKRKNSRLFHSDLNINVYLKSESFKLLRLPSLLHKENCCEFQALS